MEQSAPPAGGDQDRGDNILAALWAPFPIMFFMMAARLYVRIRTKSIGLDDWSMFVAFMLAFVGDIFETLFAKNGGGRHVFYLSIHTISNIIKYNYVATPLYIMSFAFAKTSIGLLLLRILGQTNKRWPKWLLYGCLGFYFVGSIENAALQIFACVPPDRLWEIPMKPGTKCLDKDIGFQSGYIVSGFGVFVDVLLALFPIYIVWGLNLDIKKKINICIMMGLGIFAAIASALKVYHLRKSQGSTDPTFANYGTIIWSSVEVAIVLICGSVPPLKALYDHILGNKPLPVGSHLGSGNGYPSNNSHQRHTNDPSTIRATNDIELVNKKTPSARSDDIDRISMNSGSGLV